LADHAAKIGASRARWQARALCISPDREASIVQSPLTVSETLVRVNYSETDQMGVVYHARHVVWLDIARTEHLRQAGFNYRELEARDFRLVVTDLRIRYLKPARYDDSIRIRCWVRDVASRRVIFGYAIEHAEAGTLLATAETSLICLDGRHELSRLPIEVRQALNPIPDPVRL
jgi:acyl-CoA thioester hydrolase